MRGLRGGLAAAALCAAGAGGAWAFDAESVHQAHCAGCHARITGGDGTVLYGREDGPATDRAGLEARVAHCAAGAGLAWGERERAAMVEYLDERYYRFGER